MKTFYYCVVWGIVLGVSFQFGGYIAFCIAMLSLVVMSLVIFYNIRTQKVQLSQSQRLKDKARQYYHGTNDKDKIPAIFSGHPFEQLAGRKTRKRDPVLRIFWNMLISLASPAIFIRRSAAQPAIPKRTIREHIQQLFCNIAISLGLAIPMLGYSVAGASVLALLRPGLRGWQGPWHMATGASYFIGVALLIWSYFATSECRTFLQLSANRLSKQRNHKTLRRVRIINAAEYSFLIAYVLGMVLGSITSAHQPEKENLNWWAIAHQYASNIQGPVLLTYLWLFYIGYVLMIKYTLDLHRHGTNLGERL